MSQDTFLSTLAQLGGKASQAKLIAALGWELPQYETSKEALLQAGKIKKVQGPGQTLRLAEDEVVKSQEEALAPSAPKVTTPKVKATKPASQAAEAPAKKMPQLSQMQQMSSIEAKLWTAADTLRSNSNFAANEYFMPVMGLIFLRHAYSRFLTAEAEIKPTLPTRGGVPRAMTPADFSSKGALYLRPESQYDHLVNLPDSADRAEALIQAMELIEKDYESLQGALPKNEYKDLDNEVLGALLRKLNPEELKNASGDIFGRIYEYFLTEFANLKAHDGGEFFTPVSLVSFLANVIETSSGKVLDPACGSGGMFVQGAHYLERQHQRPGDRLTFYGMEKNPTTIRLAKMNLAVHGLEGKIAPAISYYQDPHELLGQCDYVMANPPFNTDEIDAAKVKNDPRLPFGIPGINDQGKVSNGNYLWISYFYSYLNATGRAGFVMSAQASSAGRDEAKVRQKLIATGHVEAMVSIRGGFFYTRTVPCELWFFNKSKPEAQRDQVLMIDARNTHRKVTRTVYDFSPEQEKDLLAIVWLYRGQPERFRALLADHCRLTLKAASACPDHLSSFLRSLDELIGICAPFFTEQKKHAALSQAKLALFSAFSAWQEEETQFLALLQTAQKIHLVDTSMAPLHQAVKSLMPLAASSRKLSSKTDNVLKLCNALIAAAETANAKNNPLWPNSRINGNGRDGSLLKSLEAARKELQDQLHQLRHFFTHAESLSLRFPEGQFRAVEGLCKAVSFAELEANEWSLTPGRYVGVAAEDVDEDFDFAQSLRDIHSELATLNAQAIELAKAIQSNFEALV